MEREQIIKALECCTMKQFCAFDSPCPWGYMHSGNRLYADALKLIKELTEENERLRAEAGKQSKIKWVNRPISAQYATVTDENGEKHYGKMCDRIENNPVGYCGECGKRLDDTFMNYCPNCGAKMKGE